MAQSMSLRSGDLKSSIWRTSSRMTTSNKPLNDNLKFYQGKIKSNQGTGYKIDEMLSWKGDYDNLEWNHSYIQWLFPIPEGNGLNYFAQALQDQEAEAIKGDKQLQKKVIAAFEMMLDFYGMELTSTIDGGVQRCKKNWDKRYENLNWSSHNYLRITRIIKSIGQLGLERFQKPWVSFILYEAIVEKTLPRLNGGSIYHWINAICDPGQRQEVFVLHEQYMNESKQRLEKTREINQTNTDTIKKDHEKYRTSQSYKSKTKTNKDGLKTGNLNTPRILNSNVRDDYEKSEQSKADTADIKISDKTDIEIKHTSGRFHEEDIHISNSSTTKQVNLLDKNVTSKSIKSASFDRTKDVGDAPTMSKKMPKDTAFAEIKPREPGEWEEEKINAPRVCDSDWGDAMPIEVDTTEGNMPDSATRENDANLLFYQCKIRSNCDTGPDIEEMLTWKDNYDTLDGDPFYIQWLFPISHSTGINRLAKPLQAHEAQAIVNDDVLRTRYMKAFEIMLAFYGMEMVIEHPKVINFHRTYDWRRRFDYLNEAPHNLMRITRILKSLGEFGYSNLQEAWLSYMFEEIFTQKTLTEIDGETIGYWIEALEEDIDRLNMFERFQKMSIGWRDN